MTVAAFRLTKTRYVSTAFEGEGARLHGGRWNSIGTRIVYTAESRSLAALELLVHTEDRATLEKEFSIIRIQFPEEFIEYVDTAQLPAAWSASPPQAATQSFGDAWIQRSRSALLRVPSAIIPEEFNYLLNPVHPDFSRVVVGPPQPFRLDPRLGQGA